ncbi:SMP-30/gluconolactonase/LRE family protein [Flavihumibacter sp. R14]|nr:SMP-30/gluconolactonase/LRE family protein [Flavihumibacter soli]
MKNFLILFFIATTSCTAQTSIGTIERYDSSVNAIVSPEAKAVIIASGYEWSEGPVWIEKDKMLLFSDIPGNTIYKWTVAKGAEIYLTPSGYTGTAERGGETGSNGLTLDKNGALVLCQHGDRRMARMAAPVSMPSAKFITLAGNYQGKKFNSPNDAVFNSKGELFFTDPPYGLENGMEDPGKELPFQGVYKVNSSGEVVLLVDTLTRPNGIAFFPGEKTFIVANSDGEKPNWYAFDIDENNSVYNARIFYSAKGSDRSLKGGPDGLKIDKNGNVFATGPGGIWIFNRSGKLLGKLRLDEAASNCALSPDEKTLYITNDMYVVEFKMR